MKLKDIKANMKNPLFKKKLKKLIEKELSENIFLDDLFTGLEFNGDYVDINIWHELDKYSPPVYHIVAYEGGYKKDKWETNYVKPIKILTLSSGSFDVKIKKKELT